MEWFFAVLGAITGMISIPASVLAFRAIREDIQRRKSGSGNAVADISAAITPPGQRVLIEFEQARADTPGTFENAVMTFAKACPPGPEGRWLIHNPRGVFVANEAMVRVYSRNAAHSLFAMLLTWIAFILAFAVSAPAETRADLGLGLLLALLLVLSGAPFLLWSYSSRRTAEHHKTIRDAAQAYLAYLREREIEIGVEFTQSRRMHDREQNLAASTGARPA